MMTINSSPTASMTFGINLKKQLERPLIKVALIIAAGGAGYKGMDSFHSSRYLQACQPPIQDSSACYAARERQGLSNGTGSLIGMLFAGKALYRKPKKTDS